MKKVRLSSLGRLVMNNQQTGLKITHSFASGGWFRIAELISTPSGGLISAHNSYMKTPPGGIVFAFNVRNTVPVLTVLHRAFGPISTIRITSAVGTIQYLEIFINSTGPETLHFYATNHHSINFFTVPVPGSIPEGGSATEFTV